MRKVLFEWRGVRIHSYTVMLYLGLVLGIAAGNYAANIAELDAAGVFVAMILLTIPGLVGARLLFVGMHWSIYRYSPGRIWRRAEGGAALFGGVPLAVAASVPLLDALRIPFGAFWDVATFTMLTWLIFGRIGCVLHGCCGGQASDRWFALSLPDIRGVWRRRIPTQLMDMGLASVLLLASVGTWRLMPFPGALFLCVLATYGVGRVVLQPTREVPTEARATGSPWVQSAVWAGSCLTSGGLFLLVLHQHS